MNKSLPVKHITNMLNNEDITNVIFQFVGHKPKRWSWLRDEDFNKCAGTFRYLREKNVAGFRVNFTEYIIGDEVNAQELHISFRLTNHEEETFFKNDYLSKEYFVEDLRKVKDKHVRFMCTVAELEYYDNSDDDEDEGEVEPEFATRSVEYF